MIKFWIKMLKSVHKVSSAKVFEPVRTQKLPELLCLDFLVETESKLNENV